MEDIQHKKGKLFYSMGEVTEMFDVNASLIRFWEQKFDMLKPHKNKKGNRMFTPRDVDTLRLIYHLVKEKGMTLEGARKRIRDNREGTSRDLEIIERLQAVRAMLQEIREELGGTSGDESEVFDSMDIQETPDNDVAGNGSDDNGDTPNGVSPAAQGEFLETLFDLGEDVIRADTEASATQEVGVEVLSRYGNEPDAAPPHEMDDADRGTPASEPGASVPEEEDTDQPPRMRIIEQTLF